MSETEIQTAGTRCQLMVLYLSFQTAGDLPLIPCIFRGCKVVQFLLTGHAVP